MVSKTNLKFGITVMALGTAFVMMHKCQRSQSGTHLWRTPTVGCTEGGISSCFNGLGFDGKAHKYIYL